MKEMEIRLQMLDVLLKMVEDEENEFIRNPSNKSFLHLKNTINMARIGIEEGLSPTTLDKEE